MLKLVKLLNLTQSDNDNEALTAIRMANKLLKSQNKTWEDVINRDKSWDAKDVHVTPFHTHTGNYNSTWGPYPKPPPAPPPPTHNPPPSPEAHASVWNDEDAKDADHYAKQKNSAEWDKFWELIQEAKRKFGLD